MYLPAKKIFITTLILFTGTAGKLTYSMQEQSQIQEKYNDKLLTGAESDDLQTVTDALSKKAYIETKGKWGFTPLRFACYFGHLEIAKYLIEQGAQVAAEPLISACANGHQGIVEYLVEHGAPINPQTTVEMPPLSMALSAKHLAIATYLLDKGANPNEESGYNQTPVLIALRNGYFKFAKKLIGRGASIHQKGPETLMSFACNADHLDMVAYLIAKGTPIQTRDLLSTSMTMTGKKIYSLLMATLHFEKLKNKEPVDQNEHQKILASLELNPRFKDSLLMRPGLENTVLKTQE
jgi:ankyrin repeat protein